METLIRFHGAAVAPPFDCRHLSRLRRHDASRPRREARGPRPGARTSPTSLRARAIAYASNNNFTGRKYFPQPMCGGIAILDYDNDGRMDIFFTNGAKLPELKKTESALLQLPAAQQRRRHVSKT